MDDEDALPNHPNIIHSRGSFEVNIDGVGVGVCQTASDVLMMWEASFYVFDQKCPKMLKNLSWFLRKYIFPTPVENAQPDLRAVEQAHDLEKQ